MEIAEFYCKFFSVKSMYYLRTLLYIDLTNKFAFFHTTVLHSSVEITEIYSHAFFRESFAFTKEITTVDLTK